MWLNDRLLTVWTYVVGVGLSLLGMAAYVFDWPLVIQLAFPWVLFLVLGGTDFAVKRARRRH
jgi:hypothetical protein